MGLPLDFDISGSGNKIAFTAYDRNLGQYGLYTVSASGGPYNLAASLEEGGKPCLSDDGTKVAIWNRGKAIVMNTDGSGRKEFEAPGSAVICLSGDGSRLYHTETSVYGGSATYLFDVATGQKHNDPIMRDAFAKIMVLTLKLALTKPASAAFTDVPMSHWALPYVETAKPYLTGYYNSKTGQYTYKPTGKALREDVAVAIVKALGLDNSDVLSGTY